MNDQLPVKYEKSCGFIVFGNHDDELKYLILHYSAEHWDYAKGHVEKEETEHETAIRELEEETGITNISILDGYREPMNYSFRHK